MNDKSIQSFNLKYIHSLIQFRDTKLSELVQMLGPKSQIHELGSVCWSSDPSDSPRIWYRGRPNAPVDVLLSNDASIELESSDSSRAFWQLAHECVHLLDADWNRGDQTNVLEEGLATWYQDMRVPCRHSDFHCDNYKQAKNLVIAANTLGLLSAVNNIRAKGVQMGDITAEMLKNHIPQIDADLAAKLASPFKY